VCMLPEEEVAHGHHSTNFTTACYIPNRLVYRHNVYTSTIMYRLNQSMQVCVTWNVRSLHKARSLKAVALRKQEGKLWTACIWPRIWSDDSLLWTWQWMFRFPKRQRIRWPAEWLISFSKRTCSMQVCVKTEFTNV
jgi:hypothetical protein